MVFRRVGGIVIQVGLRTGRLQQVLLHIGQLPGRRVEPRKTNGQRSAVARLPA